MKIYYMIIFILTLFINSCVQQPIEPSPSKNIDDEYYSWSIEDVCIPVEKLGQTPKLIQDLEDGTYIYRNPNGSLFRGSANQCKCLTATTLISTPYGDKLIKDLKLGMLVWTSDSNGNKISARIVKLSKVPVPNDYVVVHLVLDNNREIFASAAHPLADGRTINDITTNDIIDGSRVVSKEIVPYQGYYTYDILPAGETGSYWANGILLGSTLAKS